MTTETHDDLDRDGFGPAEPVAEGDTLTTREAIATVADGLRTINTPLLSEVQLKMLCVAFTAIVDAFERRDPSARAALSHLAIGRLRRYADDDLRCATLAYDESDPLHHEFLILCSRHMMRSLVAEKRAGPAEIADMLGRVLRR